MIELPFATLADVIGAVDNTNALGRCGPGEDMQFLGNVYTNECLAHDLVVRGALENGDSQLMAHVKALPLLPAAVGSYFRGLIFGS